mmetsp:Transcript_2889/g.5416  ORF Transcript_2889/g.5416 Transcript_2889/m.5416 type:complete len:486 (+) Transcript_2889:621-2078(+)
MLGLLLKHKIFACRDGLLSVGCGLAQSPTSSVLLPHLLCFLDHALHLFVAQPTLCLHLHALLGPRPLVFGHNIDNTVGVQLETNDDLGHSLRQWGNAIQRELAQQLIVLCNVTLPLVHLDCNVGLHVLDGGVLLLVFAGNRSVPVDDARKHAPDNLCSQGQRSNVDQDQSLRVTLQDTALDGGTLGDHLIRVHSLRRLLPKELPHCVDHLRSPRHTSNEQHLANGTPVDPCIFQALLARLHAPRHDVVNDVVKLFPRELVREVITVARDEGNLDTHHLPGVQLLLCLLCGLTEAVGAHQIAGQILPRLIFEDLDEMITQCNVHVLSPQEGVTIGRLDLKHTTSNLQKRHIECATSQIKNDHLSGMAAFVQAIGQGSCSGLIDDTHDFQACNFASVFGGLALGVVEVSWHCNDSLGHALLQVFVCGLLHLLQHERPDLGGGVWLAFDFNPCIAALIYDLVGQVLQLALDVTVPPTNQPLHSVQGIL